MHSNWFVRGDVDSFFGLFFRQAGQFDCLSPSWTRPSRGSGVGRVLYVWQARRLMRRSQSRLPWSYPSVIVPMGLSSMLGSLQNGECRGTGICGDVGLGHRVYGEITRSGAGAGRGVIPYHSTVTDFAKLRGWSMSHPRSIAQ